MAKARPLDPPMSETRPPQLDRFDWQHLERLAEALMAHEPDVVTASQYGTSRQAQFGIDTKAELTGGGCDVASCKRYARIETGHLTQWSSDFLDHWHSQWKAKGVRRFILVTTADIASTRVVELADVERKRFRPLGVGYELWGQPQLIEKMRPHRGIVAQFVGTPWVDIICGTQQREALQPDGASVGIRGVGASPIAELRSILSGEAEQRVARGLEDLRAGDVDAVERAIVDLRAEPLWAQLEGGARARILRFAASAALTREDLASAVALADEADAIEPAIEPRIAARIAYQRDGARAGLATLGAPTTRDGRQLQVAFLLTVGDLDSADAVLAQLAQEEHDPETTRLHTWALLMRNRREEALALVAELEAEAGQWIATIRTAAIVRYAASLSPVLKAEWFLNASPVDLDLVRDDDEGRAYLDQAVEGLRRLSERTPDLEDRRWLLAALANQRDGREDAETLARSLLAELPGDPTTIAWSLARRFNVELAPSRAILADKYATGTAEQIDVRVYALMLVADGDHATTRATLQASAAKQSGETLVEAQTWITRLGAEIGQATEGASGPATDDLVDAIQQARRTGEWAAVVKGFDELARGDEPQPQMLAIAQLLAGEAQWSILAPHRDALLRFATAEAVRIVAYVLAAIDSDDALLEFLETHRSAFRNSAIPPDVRRLVVDRQRRAGDLVAALAEASALSAQSGTSTDRHLEAQLKATIGDTAGAATIVRDLLRTADLDAAAALRWGETLRASDMALAQELWRYAVALDAERQHSIAAFMQAYSLGLEQEASPLFAEVARVAQDGSSVVRTMDVSELPAFLSAQNADAEARASLYLDGRVPVQLFIEQQNTGLDALLLANGEAAGPLRLRLLRSGARPRHIVIGRPWSTWRLHMDLGALLIAAEQDLLDIVERHPNPITISSAVPAALLDMQRRLTATQPARLQTLRELSALFGVGITARPVAIGDRVVALREDEHAPPSEFSPSGFIRAAFRSGVIDEAAQLQALAALAEEQSIAGEEDALPTLASGAAVWMAGAAAEQLARTGLLPILIVAFGLAIDPEIAAITRHYVASETAKGARFAWLDTLRERLLRGVETGRFVFVKRRAEREANVDELREQSPATVSLMDILIADEVEGAVTWFEDRNLTGYPANRNHVIVELVDVLDALVADHLLSAAEARARLTRFLGTGGGFVQLEAEDIITALRTAPIIDGMLRETPDLIAIRRNRAATRLLDERLKVGPSADIEDTRPDEVQLLTAEMRLAQNCLTAIWSDPTQSIADCIVRSEWTWRTLRLERTLRDIPESEPGGAARMLATMCFAHSAESLAIPSDVPREMRKIRRRAFADWFWNAVLIKHMIGDPDIITRIAAHITDLYLPRLNGRDPTATDNALERDLVKIRIAALPLPVMNALALHARFGSYLGLSSTEVITVRRHRFEAARFWRAVRTARRYGRARLRTLDGKACRVTRTEDGVAFTGALRARIAEMLCGIFDTNVAPVAKFADLLDGLELAAADRAIAMDAAGRATAPVDFGSALAAARKRSAKAIYTALDNAFQPNLRIAGENFVPPPATALLYYLRLEPGEGDFSVRVQRAAARLRNEVGPREALGRLAGLPLANLVDLLSIDVTNELRAELARGRTPTAVFRWAEVERQADGSPQGHRAVGARVVERVRHAGAALVSLLDWTAKAFWRDPEFRALGSADRLALIWVHASRVLETFLRRGADPALVSRFFAEANLTESMAEVLNPARLVEADAASPATLNTEALTFHLLGALLGDAPLDDLLDEPTQEAVQSALTLGAEQRAPIPALTIRNFDGENLLGSMLIAAPSALSDLVLQPQAVRDAMIRRSIETIEGDHFDALSWALLAQHARTGLSEDADRGGSIDAARLGREPAFPWARATRCPCHAWSSRQWGASCRPTPGRGSST